MPNSSVVTDRSLGYDPVDPVDFGVTKRSLKL